MLLTRVEPRVPATRGSPASRARWDPLVRSRSQQSRFSIADPACEDFQRTAADRPWPILLFGRMVLFHRMLVLGDRGIERLDQFLDPHHRPPLVPAGCALRDIDWAR